MNVDTLDKRKEKQIKKDRGKRKDSNIFKISNDFGSLGVESDIQI